MKVQEQVSESAARKRLQVSEPGKNLTSNLDQVEKVLPSVLAKLGLEKRLREHTLMQVWSGLLSEKLAQRCRPLFIDHQHNLVVAVADAAVAQELSLMKSRLVKGLAATARSLGIELVSLRMDMKNFHRLEEKAVVEEPPLPQPSDAELLAITLSNHDMQLICDLSRSLPVAQGQKAELNVMVLRAYERQLRLAEWRHRHSFPVCQACDNPVSRLFARGNLKVCFNCLVCE
jgi:hypothetical protein